VWARKKKRNAGGRVEEREFWFRSERRVGSSRDSRRQRKVIDAQEEMEHGVVSSEGRFGSGVNVESGSRSQRKDIGGQETCRKKIDSVRERMLSRIEASRRSEAEESYWHRIWMVWMGAREGR